MTREEKQKFLIEQTCILLAGRIANSNTDHTAKNYIEKYFEETFKALSAELKKSYISTAL